MKTYYNGQRQGMNYGGGANMRKPMMLGGLAEKNKGQGAMSSKTSDAMSMMTDQKKFGMGMNLGGAIKKFEKKSAGGKTGAKPDYIDIDNDGNTTESMKQAAKQKKNKKG